MQLKQRYFRIPKIFPGLVAFAMLLAVGIIGGQSLLREDRQTEERTMVTVGEAAPGFTLESVDGTQVSLASYRGQEDVLLYFSMAHG